MENLDLPLIIFILKQICLGSLVSGLLIFLLTLIFTGGHLFDHDADLDHDIDHEVSFDHDIGDVDVGGDISIDKDIHIGVDKDIHVGVDKAVDLHDHGFDADTPAPLMLLLGTFLISFGGTGVILLDSAIHFAITLSLIALIPIGVTYLVSKSWAKLAVSEIYETALETISVDDEVKTLTTVDTDGGLVLIHTSSIHGPVKMSAKTRTGAIAKGMIAYVVEVQKNSVIIDEWPSTDKKAYKVPEGSVKWD
jgi:hypothetical protein